MCGRPEGDILSLYPGEREASAVPDEPSARVERLTAEPSYLSTSPGSDAAGLSWNAKYAASPEFATLDAWGLSSMVRASGS